MSKAWGASGQHYANDFPDNASDSEKARRWAHLATKLNPNAEQEVARAVKTWNKVVRDQLRDEMGFRLSSGKRQVTVPVVVSDGMPKPLLDELGDGDGIWAELLIRRRLFLDTEDGVDATGKLLGLITRALRGQAPSAKELESLDTVKTLLEELNRALHGRQLPDRILRIDQDVLGAYYLQIPKVRIFWLPIAILSASAGLSVEALTFVVLAHELAHAYTHLGFDIDGEAWDAGDFARSDLELVEGLAQYYAEAVCNNVVERFPAAIECFKWLLEKQHSAYTGYQAWDQTDSGESMRAFLRDVSKRTLPRPRHTSGLLDAVDEQGR